jgi:serine/threonine protein kinase
MPLSTGHRVGPYEIQALLGVGGMGEVYKGRDTRLGRDVALKVIAPTLAGNPSFRYRFENEARAASALNHPAIVTVYDVGDIEGVAWIAMEWVEGRTLRHALSHGPLSVREAWSISRRAEHARALRAARSAAPQQLLARRSRRVV